MPIVRAADLDHRSLKQPALADPLWRYMDFTKFIAMLVAGKLYLSRLDQLGDDYEGWVPQPPKNHYRGFFKETDAIRDRELKERSSNEKCRYYVSCWHANDEESDAMWKVYVKGNEGIALRTTCRNLRASLEVTPEELWLHNVEYDYSEKEPTHGGSMLRACMTKRKPFRHEQEVRVVWHRGEGLELPPGFYVDCKLETLIEQVYVAPAAKDWFVSLVEKVLEKYGIRKEVVQKSGLSSKPL